MGFFFENLCIRDLRIYADALDGTVYHYRDKNGLECDAVIHLRGGAYGLAEIKLGGEKLIQEGIATLNKLESNIDISKLLLLKWYSQELENMLTIKMAFLLFLLDVWECKS